MAAGDPGTKKRNYSAIAVETKLLNSIASASQGDTTANVVVNSISGFPSTLPYTLILDPDTSKEEVVTVTATNGSTTLTIKRGEDNTQAVAHQAGVVVRHGVSAREFKELQTHIAARGVDADSALLNNVDSHVHGLQTGDGSVVGSTQAVTLTRKTLGTGTSISSTVDMSSGTISGGTITSAVVTSSTINSSTFTSGTVTSSTIQSGTLGTDLAAGGFKVTGLGTPSAGSDAATKTYADTKLSLAGGTMTGAISMGTSKITNLGTPTATADAATKGYVDTSIANLIDTAPSTLDTLNELAAALGDDPNFATTMTNALATKLDKAGGTMTGAINMGTYKITSLGTPTASDDAATKAYADLKLALTGGTLSGALSLGSNKITNLATPTASTDAVNKDYIDTLYGSTVSAAYSATQAATSATSAAASATAAATSATSAAASATAAATSATSASNSATSSANSATAAATSASSAATSASSSAASATLASEWAIKVSGPVSGSDYSAKYNADLANTSANSANTSASSAATSESNALTSANSAATSATAAATSATSAATSASSAATSATSAATSASSAATTYTNYDQRYLGSKSTPPTVDNLGNALITGATYWNSGNATMYAWSGSAWTAISAAAAVSSVLGTAGRISSSGGSSPVIDLVTSGVTAGTYQAATITVDAYGRVTSASVTAVDPIPQILMLMGA